MRSTILLLLICPALVFAVDLDAGGHTKLRVVGQSYPDDSLLHDLSGNSSADLQGDLRFNLSGRSGGWSFAADYQLQALRADRLEFAGALPPDAEFLLAGLPTDERRLFDLTSVIDEQGKSAILHRLDRLWLGYSNESTVVRFGRQALSWGNGLFFAPMDLVNPFDPATIDAEYKTGDDMLYGQYLWDSGADLQGAYVIRRNTQSGDAQSDEATFAFKYHTVAAEREYDVLLAKSYDDTVIGFGASQSIGGAVWSADAVVTDTDSERIWQFVTNLSYSWMWAGKNLSGTVEYFFNGFGQRAGRYSPIALSANVDLLERIGRGELFSLGRNYLATSVTIEMTPLLTLSPTVLINAGDPSALFQMVTNYSVSDNMTLLASLNVPMGPNGSEYGGIDSGLPNRYLSNDGGLFLQFAWYF